MVDLKTMNVLTILYKKSMLHTWMKCVSLAWYIYRDVPKHYKSRCIIIPVPEQWPGDRAQSSQLCPPALEAVPASSAGECDHSQHERRRDSAASVASREGEREREREQLGHEMTSKVLSIHLSSHGQSLQERLFTTTS